MDQSKVCMKGITTVNFKGHNICGFWLIHKKRENYAPQKFSIILYIIIGTLYSEVLEY